MVQEAVLEHTGAFDGQLAPDPPIELALEDEIGAATTTDLAKPRGSHSKAAWTPEEHDAISQARAVPLHPLCFSAFRLLQHVD